MQKKKVNLFIYPTYNCYSNCSFCYISPKLRNKKNDLTLDEIKKNLNYFKKKYSISSIALVGGDPLLYPDLIPLMDFLNEKYFNINSGLHNFTMCTEALECSSVDFSNYLTSFFNKRITDLGMCFHVSLNNFSKKSKDFNQKKEAIINLAKKRIRIRFVLVFVRNNLETIENAINFLSKIFSEYYKGKYSRNFVIELRLPFNLRHNKERMFISDSNDFMQSFHKTTNIILKNKMTFNLRNIPLCYLDRKNMVKKELEKYYSINPRARRTTIRVDKKHQLNYAGIGTYSDKTWLFQKECLNCKLRSKCNGINLRYIEVFNFPKLNPF